MFRNLPMPTVLAFLSLLLFSIIVAYTSSVMADRLVELNPRVRPSSSAVSRLCERTRFPKLCADSLLEASDVEGTVNEMKLLHMSFNATLRRFSRALYLTSGIGGRISMHPLERTAYDDCLELLDDSVYALNLALSYVSVSNGASSSSPEDVVTWLSSAMTNQDTCKEGFDGVGALAGTGAVKYQVTEQLRDLSELVSNCLAIFTAAHSQDFSGVPIENKRRRLMSSEPNPSRDRVEFPAWLTGRERRLLDVPVAAVKPDIVVSQDGMGTFKTISEAIKKTPDYSSRRIIIYVKAGRYEENILKVGRKKTNLMFIGDGKGITVITGGKSVLDNMTTFHTASFAASGSGFIARDMTFENYAGPMKHQAVALRVGADHAVVYRCNIVGYQDTLYVHSNRQFFRECDIYGTVDFVFGNAAVVFQNCSLYARKPLAFQKNTITAQNRKDPNQNTGISIHACRILATSDLSATTPSGTFSTYLGRPWKLFSRVVYLMSYIGDHVHPRGWLEWNATFALDTLYYGEYLNFGPQAGVDQRVKWLGYRVINSSDEAGKFTVGQFIFGSAWLPSTGVTFLAGLSV